MTTPLSTPLECFARPNSNVPNRERAHALDASELRARSSEVQAGLREHLPALLRHAARRARTREEALDLVQETALRALAFAWSFEPGTNLRGWLHQVQDSVFLTQCRKRTRERRAFDAFHLDPCAWPKHEPEPAMRRMTQSVSRALDELPPNFRDVVRLVDVDDLSYRDAADTLRVPLGTIMSRLHRGRRMLATALADSHSARSPRRTTTTATARRAPSQTSTTRRDRRDHTATRTDQLHDGIATRTDQLHDHTATRTDQLHDHAATRTEREQGARPNPNAKRRADHVATGPRSETKRAA